MAIKLNVTQKVYTATQNAGASLVGSGGDWGK